MLGATMEFVTLVLAVIVAILVFMLLRTRSRLSKIEQIVARMLSNNIGSSAPASSGNTTGVAPKAAIAAASDVKPAVKKSSPVAANTSFDPWQNAAENSADDNAALLARSGYVKAKSPHSTRKRYIFNSEGIKSAFVWAKLNWFYLVAASSLGLAGVFLVQYGAEKGLLPPALRVVSALALGVSLIAGGEFLRRKGGDGMDDLFAYLPSTFAAGGLLSLFAGILSARSLYGLIGAETALFGLALVGGIAVLIGWFYGPLLAAIGILGAVIAPFVVGGEPGMASLLFGYFAIIAIVGMVVDAFKRWAWLSAFATVLTFVAALNVYIGTGEAVAFLGFAIVTLIASTIIPEWRLLPQQTGTMMVEELASILRKRNKSSMATSFPTRLVSGVFAAATAATLFIYLNESDAFWLSFAVFSGLFALAAIWMQQARALGDLALLPVIGLPWIVWLEAQSSNPVFKAWLASADRFAEEPAPWTLMILLATALIISLLAAWRAFTGTVYPNTWALVAAGFAPLIAVIAELSWQPAMVIGTDNWAYHVIAIAAVMVLLAERFARKFIEDRSAAAYFSLAAMTMISLALTLMLTATALTLALSVMVLGATYLDRRFNLPALCLFVITATGVISWRLVLDPGVFRMAYMPFSEFVLTFAGTLLLLFAARLLLKRSPRTTTFAFVDSAFWSLSAVFLSLLIGRVIDIYWPTRTDSHAVISLVALVWLVSAANQLWRMQFNETRRWIRITLAIVYGLAGFGALAGSTFIINPLVSEWNAAFGPYIIDSLFVAYALPALFFVAVAANFTHLPRWLRFGLGGIGVFYTGLYVALEIRRFWRGDVLHVPGTTDPELYSYTVAMLLCATGLLFYAFYRRNNMLRKLALVGIGLTVAKVFLIDVSGLTGLTRVFSFLILGLSLAGLAWLDRWFGAKSDK